MKCKKKDQLMKIKYKYFYRVRIEMAEPLGYKEGFNGWNQWFTTVPTKRGLLKFLEQEMADTDRWEWHEKEYQKTLIDIISNLKETDLELSIGDCFSREIEINVKFWSTFRCGTLLVSRYTAVDNEEFETN